MQTESGGWDRLDERVEQYKDFDLSAREIRREHSLDARVPRPSVTALIVQSKPTNLPKSLRQFVNAE